MKIPIISGLVERRVDEILNEKRNLSKFDDFLDYLISGGESTAGVKVNEKSALASTAVFACVRILSETIASLPLPVYRRMEPRGKERANGHPLYKILHDAPNPYMTSFAFRETMQAHLATWGNAYADIRWHGNGQVKELWPLRPDKMKEIKFNDQGKLVYKYTLPDGQDTVLDAGRVFHIPGLGFDGVVGYSPIAMAQNAIGLAIATEEFGGTFFRNGAKPGGVLRHPGKLSDGAKEGLSKAWDKLHKGLTNSHRVAILEEGMDYTQIGIPPNDAQFLETRRFQTEEIARIYRVPPHMLADLTRATFSNIEHQSIDFVVHTIRPWLVRWEQGIKNKLFNAVDRERYFAEFLVDGLLRGDTATRYQAYSIARQWGWASANDVRESENLNPIGEQGDNYLIPMNMISADQVNDYRPKAEAPPEPEEEEDRTAGPVEKRFSVQGAKIRTRLALGYLGIIRDAVARIVSGEVSDLRRAVKSKLVGEKDPTDFLGWVKEYYETKMPERIKKTMLPVFMALGEVIQVAAAEEVGAEGEMTPEVRKFIDDYNDVFAKRHVGSSRGQLEALVRDSVAEGLDPAEVISERLDGWSETRTGQTADGEVVRYANAVARAVFIGYGIVRLKWVAAGSDPCEFCQSLNGKVVGIEQPFASAGSEIDAGEKRLPISTNTTHPPIHKGCECEIVPER